MCFYNNACGLNIFYDIKNNLKAKINGNSFLATLFVFGTQHIDIGNAFDHFDLELWSKVGRAHI
jgi:hypothetical protein